MRYRCAKRELSYRLWWEFNDRFAAKEPLVCFLGLNGRNAPQSAELERVSRHWLILAGPRLNGLDKGQSGRFDVTQLLQSRQVKPA